MDHFKGVNDQERFNNDLLNETRQTRLLLERIAQALESTNKEEKHGTTTSGFQRTTGRKLNA